ncbi:hypothetical protein ASD11_05495 [Aeromicrobium sp. Root495]|uniref:Trp biosynthesis-associated membrane protein n=1 Tax=Aeromicrobium sp. Root495 TaxID=1736550 RepID=UPI0006F739DB|nr:Trp biosynthesis-associated membrane protein [Aeromicrobium sp. Root495]KQY59060.1 hypothetical protein ASD11_05495 [Aeromicrobium sp. Root495]
MSARLPAREKLLVPVVLGLLVAGGGAFLALSRTWQRADVQASGAPSDRVEVTGTAAYPAATALALVVLTAGLAILAAGRRTRRVVGVLVVLVSVGALVMLVPGDDSLDSALREAVEKSPSFTGGNQPDSVVTTGWILVAWAGFVLAAVLGVVAALHGGRWSTMSGRYDAPGARRPDVDPDDPMDLWKAQDRGDDPTA